MGIERFQQLLFGFNVILLLHQVGGLFEHRGSFRVSRTNVTLHLFTAFIETRNGNTNAFELL